MATAELFTSAGAHHGEGPFWDEQNDRLLFVDSLAGAIVAVEMTGEYTRYPSPSPVVTVIRRRVSGGFAVGTEHGIAICDDSFSVWHSIAQVTANSALRTNDGGCDPLGGFVIGTMARDEAPGCGSVYRVAADHQLVTLLTDVSISNGVQWSTDGSQVFYIDTPTRRVDTFVVNPDTGLWSDRRPHIQFGLSDGLPDGMAIDEDGGLWIALWNAGVIRRYDALGQQVATIEVPGVSQVSSCTFGGRDRSILFITTSRMGLEPDEESDAGRVFAIQTDTRGAALAEFTG